MMRARKSLLRGVVTLGVLAGGLLLDAAPALAAAPEVKSEKVVSVTPSEARLEAVVDAGEEPTECHLRYGKATVSEKEVSCDQATLEGGEQGVSVTVTGLQPGTAYRYRVVVKNATGEAEGAEAVFTTLAQPLIASEEALSITRVTATISAAIDPGGYLTTYRILYGETSGYGEHTAEFDEGTEVGEETVRVGLAGLTPGTTYHYAVVATNQVGTTTSPDETFTTSPPTPPTATTGGASNVTLTTATVAGTIDPEDLETSYELDLGTSTEYGTSIYGEAGLGSTTNIEVPLKYLAPDTTYHYRIDAINSDGRTYGADATFTTPAYSAPIVQPPTLALVPSPAIAFPTGTEPTQEATTKKTAKHKTAKKKNKKREHSRKGKGRKTKPGRKKG